MIQKLVVIAKCFASNNMGTTIFSFITLSSCGVHGQQSIFMKEAVTLDLVSSFLPLKMVEHLLL